MKTYSFTCLFITALLLHGVLFGQKTLSYSRVTNGLGIPEFEEGRTDFALDDINMDGHLDLLSVGDHGSPFFNSDQHGIMVWFGDGQGNFQNFSNGQFGYGGIAVGDVNNDGYKDVGYGVHHNYSGTNWGDQLIEVVLGDGTGMNWTSWDEGLATNGETWGMFGTAFADFNNNSLLDLVSISFGCCSGLQVYLNQSDGTWVNSFGFLNGNTSLLVRVFDINKDGFMDIISGHQYGTVYFGDGTGNFINNDSGLPGAGNTARAGFDVAYLNPEALTGISFTNSSGGVFVYSWNHGSSGWQNLSGTLPASGTYQMTQLCDMNSDGFADVMAFGNRNFKLWLGDGAGNWTPDATFMTDGNPGLGRAMRTGGDFDNNGYADLVILAQELSGGWIQFDKNFLYVYFENNPAESLWIKAVYPLGSETFYPGSVRFVEWRSAVPGNVFSTVKIEISALGPDGPWWLVAENLPNNGKHQWIVPDYGSEDCYLRFTVNTDDESASTITTTPFHIPGEPTAVKLANKKNQVTVYPNPGSDFISISCKDPVFNLTLIDIHGRIVLELTDPNLQVNVSGLSPGIYYFDAKLADKSRVRGKWIKY
ncbi:MAG: T9SS type A sorting domain-containing protein [Bacteroidales bacterium]|nr:T9SS type A sorting domain-containing protein [Bacteroidales bacterium]